MHPEFRASVEALRVEALQVEALGVEVLSGRHGYDLGYRQV